MLSTDKAPFICFFDWLSGVKIGYFIGHQIFPIELIKLLMSYVKKFSKMSDSQKKKNIYIYIYIYIKSLK